MAFFGLITSYHKVVTLNVSSQELPAGSYPSSPKRTVPLQCKAERDCVAWLLDRGDWERLQREEPDVANELLRISLKLTSERMVAIISYVLTTVG
jgi:SulP family sulfate permease